MKTQTFKSTLLLLFLASPIFSMDRETIKKGWDTHRNIQQCLLDQRYILRQQCKHYKKNTPYTPDVPPQQPPVNYRDPMPEFITGKDGYPQSSQH